MLAAGHVATSARAAGRGQPGVIAVGLGSGHRNFDLWLMSPSGVKVRRLTKAPGIDTAPTWAPDGSRLAYLCRWEDDSANASGLGGALGGAIDFGPLGHHRNNGGTLCLVRPNGSGEGVLVKGMAAAAPSWAPDSRRIAFTRPNSGIYVVGADGSGLRRLTSGDDDFPEWSPDGSQIAYTTDSGLSLMSADGSHKTKLTSQPDDLGPSWSPNVKLIAFTRYTDNGREVRVIGSNGQGERRLATSDGAVLDANISMDPAPAWAPDGKRLAFDVASTKGVSSIGVVDIDGSNPRVYKHNSDGDFHPAWSPDGKAIVVTSWLAKGEGVGMLSLDESGPPRIVLNGYNNTPVWRPAR